MQRLGAISAIFFLCAGIFLGGCARRTPKKDDDQVQVDPNIKVDPDPLAKNKKDDKKKIDVPPKKVGLDADAQEKYDAALTDALASLAERKWNDALVAFETANGIQPNDFVQGEIAKLKDRIGQEGLAKNTVKNIEAVLNDGDAEEALRLTNEALKEFGDGDDADKLVLLRIQAEAIRNAEKKEGAEPRFARFKKEGDVAIAEKNLRAAVLAYEQAIEAKADADLVKTLDEIRGRLEDYDAFRKKGADLRRDPGQIEEALAAFKAAAAAWDTLQVRADIDDCQLALAKRRDTVAVADFEPRNDVGMPGAGAAIAEELLPRLKPKFDLVERGQFRQVLNELKVQQGFLDDPKQQQQIGKVAKARYLVVGSVQRLVGVSIRARLVDVRTGLVVQTAKVIAPTMEEALNQVPDLAKQLLMNDEQKMQFEQEVQQKAARPVPPAPEKPAIPPAPLVPVADAPPPAPPIMNPAPPVFVEAKVNVFRNLSPPPPDFVAPPVDPFQGVLRNRLLNASLEMGDYLFRVGRFNEALRNYEFAFQLAPDDFDIQLRLERCRPLVAPLPFVAPRPRLAVMPFMTVGNPFVVPPSLSTWTPANLSPYFAWRFEIVDPNEIYWYMGRMGVTMNDLLVNPNARRWLGRAVGARFFLFGNHIETASFDVNTYLIDSEFGFLRGTARINVRNPYELKLRLPELAELTLMTPAQQAAFLAAAQQKRFADLIFQGRQHMDARRFHEARAAFEAAVQIYPNDVQARVLLEQARGQAVFIDFQLARRAPLPKQQPFLEAQRRRQWELAQAAEAAHQRAIVEAAARDEAQRRAHFGVRLQAQNSLVSRAELAVQTKNFSFSIGLFQSALGIAPPPPAVVGVPVPVPAPPPVNFQSFAQARLEAERAEQARMTQLALVREATLRQEREKQLAAAQKQIQVERAAGQATLEAERKAEFERDLVAFNGAIKQGQGYMTQQKYEAALAAFQGAQRLAHTQKQQEQVNNYIDIIVQAQAEALAKTKDEKSAIDRRFAVERERRKSAEKQAQQNEEKYQLALAAAQSALAAKEYDTAQAKFQEAEQLFKTDAVLNGLREVESGRKAMLADGLRAEAEKKKGERVKQYLSDGKSALDARRYGDALEAFREAKKLAPDNLEAIAGLTQAEQATARLSADASRKSEEADRVQRFQRLLKSGQANLAGKQYEAAVANLAEAVRLNPTDAGARLALQKAETARDAALANATAKAAAKDRADKYQRFLGEGRLALNSKRYDDAIRAFGEAQKLLPGDATSRDYLADARAAQKAEEARIAQAAKQRAEEMKRAADLQLALTQGRAFLAARNFSDAAKALGQAQNLAPNDADVKNALRDLDQAQKQASAEAAAQKQRLTQFQTFLATGKSALAAKQYANAVKALASATTLIPDDKEAQQLFRQAQVEQRQAEEAAARARLNDLITTGQTALKAKNYEVAEKAFRSASLVDPNNPTILQGLKDAEAGRQSLAAAKLKLANFNLAMSQGTKALQTKDYKTAIASAQQALQLVPNDADALRLLQQAQTAQGNADKAAANFQAALDAGQKALAAMNYGAAIAAFNDALKLQPNDATVSKLLNQAKQGLAGAQKTANYQKAMTAGQNALTGKKYAEAIASFQQALKLFPNDKAALQQLNQAQQAQRDANKGVKMPPENPKGGDYDQAMQRGAAAEKDFRFADALRAYQDALKAKPNDKAASSRAQFAQHVTQGEQFLNNMMWLDATRELESARKLQPKNQYVLKLLQKAKNNGK